jgi:cation:H+ antiporter
MAVGLTLVAMGTSMPELMVSLTAAHTGRSEIAFANVIGSNMANVLLIVGVSASLCAITLRTRWFELGYMLLATGLACLPFAAGAVNRPIAGVMVAMLVLFCGQLLARERARHRATPHEAKKHPTTPLGWITHLALAIVGFLLLAFGADWLVEGSVAIAASLGLSQAVIGMTIVAVGTSLPELATSVVAALRKRPEISVGNILGSNIFNVGAVLGMAALIQPFPVDASTVGRLMIATVLSAIALVVVLRRAAGVPRIVGILFLLAYGGFLSIEALSTHTG